MTIDIKNTFVLFPLCTTAERLAITPYLSQVVFDTTEKHFYYWDSVQWVEF